MLMLSISILALVSFHKVQAQAILPPEPITLPEDTLLSGIRIREREHARFVFQVSDAWNGEAHLSISAFATSFKSDPDIYISQVNSNFNELDLALVGHVNGLSRLVLHTCRL